MKTRKEIITTGYNPNGKEQLVARNVHSYSTLKPHVDLLTVSDITTYTSPLWELKNLSSYCIYNDKTLANASLSPVFNQGGCGCCWAMASADLINIIFAVTLARINKTNNLNLVFPNTYVSPLNIMSCMLPTPGSPNGCDGGVSLSVLSYSSINYGKNNNFIPQTDGVQIYGISTFNSPQLYSNSYIGGALGSGCESYKNWCEMYNCLSTSNVTQPMICNNCTSTQLSKLTLSSYETLYPELSNITNSIVTQNQNIPSNIQNYYFNYRFFTKNLNAFSYPLFNYTIVEWRNLIINHILQYGAVIFNINAFIEMQTQYSSAEPVMFLKNGTFLGGHIIVCVGWDVLDYTDPVTKKETKQFCWICKNTWGNQWGIGSNFYNTNGGNGFFYLASDPTNLCGIEFGYFLGEFALNPGVSLSTLTTQADAQNYIKAHSNTANLFVQFIEPAQLYLSADFDPSGVAIPDSTNKIFINLFDTSNILMNKISSDYLREITALSRSSSVNSNTSNDKITLFGKEFTKTQFYIGIGIIALIFILIIIVMI